MDRYTLVVWKPWLQIDQFCGQKNFLGYKHLKTRIMDMESREQKLCVRNANGSLAL